MALCSIRRLTATERARCVARRRYSRVDGGNDVAERIRSHFPNGVGRLADGAGADRTWSFHAVRNWASLQRPRALSRARLSVASNSQPRSCAPMIASFEKLDRLQATSGGWCAHAPCGRDLRRGAGERGTPTARGPRHKGATGHHILIDALAHPNAETERHVATVESRRGAVAAGVVSCCCRWLSLDAGASVLAIAPFPLPAHRTQRADFPHCALRLASRGAHGGHM